MCQAQAKLTWQQFRSPTVGLSGQSLRHAHLDTGGGGLLPLEHFRQGFLTRIGIWSTKKFRLLCWQSWKKGTGERKKERKKERKGKGRNATLLQRKTSSVASRAQAGRPAGRPTDRKYSCYWNTKLGAQRQRNFSLLWTARPPWGPASLLFKGYRWYSWRTVLQHIRLDLLPTSRMSAAMPPLPIRRHDVTATVLEVGENAKFHQPQCRWLWQSQEVLWHKHSPAATLRIKSDSETEQTTEHPST